MFDSIRSSKSQIKKRLTKEDLSIEKQYTDIVIKRRLINCVLTTIVLAQALIVLVVILTGLNLINVSGFLISALLVFTLSLVRIIVNAVLLKRGTSIRELITYFNGKKL